MCKCEEIRGAEKFDSYRQKKFIKKFSAYKNIRYIQKNYTTLGDLLLHNINFNCIAITGLQNFLQHEVFCFFFYYQLHIRDRK